MKISFEISLFLKSLNMEQKKFHDPRGFADKISSILLERKHSVYTAGFMERKPLHQESVPFVIRILPCVKQWIMLHGTVKHLPRLSRFGMNMSDKIWRGKMLNKQLLQLFSWTIKINQPDRASSSLGVSR